MPGRWGVVPAGPGWDGERAAVGRSGGAGLDGGRGGPAARGQWAGGRGVRRRAGRVGRRPGVGWRPGRVGPVDGLGRRAGQAGSAGERGRDRSFGAETRSITPGSARKRRSSLVIFRHAEPHRTPPTTTRSRTSRRAPRGAAPTRRAPAERRRHANHDATPPTRLRMRGSRSSSGRDGLEKRCDLAPVQPTGPAGLEVTQLDRPDRRTHEPRHRVPALVQ